MLFRSTLATGKAVAPHPEEVPNLLNQMATSQPLNTDDSIIVNAPSSSHARLNAHLDALTSHMTGA